MKRLILMRHAKTEPWYQGVDDESRALLGRGRQDAKLVAAALQARNWFPDFVLMSTARRTRETWKAMADYFPDARTEVMEELYLAGTSALATAVRAHEVLETVMVLGHNPGIHDFAMGISSVAGSVNQKAALTLSEKMPTAVTALFEADEEGAFQPEAFRLQDFIIAKKLRPTDT